MARLTRVLLTLLAVIMAPCFFYWGAGLGFTGYCSAAMEFWPYCIFCFMHGVDPSIRFIGSLVALVVLVAGGSDYWNYY